MMEEAEEGGQRRTPTDDGPPTLGELPPDHALATDLSPMARSGPAGPRTATLGEPREAVDGPQNHVHKVPWILEKRKKAGAKRKRVEQDF